MPRSALFLLVLFLAFPAFAETAEQARKELSTTLSDIQESDAREKELERKTQELQEELKQLQQDMAAMGKDTQTQEEDLSSHEDQLAILEDQKKDKLLLLTRRQAELSAMISAMVKLRELPPEAVIAMPGKLDETMATARALGLVTRAIDDEAQSLKGQLHELDALEEKIGHSREAIASRKGTLAGAQAQLAAKIKERSALVDELGGREREEKEHSQKLMAKSQSLQELIDSLKKADQQETQKEEEGNTPLGAHEGGTKHKLRSFEAAQGEIRLPAAGKIVSHFGNPDTSATFAKGIVIETRAAANVVAPYDGEVVFAGPFRDYGSIVIIRHSDGYHTLLSGMQEINCTPGQFLLEGEPIGAMGVSSPKLYMELREDGRPVDPADWVKG